MTIDPENPLNLPFAASQAAPPSGLALLSIIREDINEAIKPFLTRQDEKAWVLVSSVSNGIFISAIALSKAGEYRFLNDLELSCVMEIWELKKQQFNDSLKTNSDERKITFGAAKDGVKDGGWLSAMFHVENDGFVIKTEYNYDKRIYSGPTPEQWFIAPEEETEDYRSVWTDDQYRDDLAMFPRKSGEHEWLS